MPLLIALHVLAAVVWVGGMFFAYMVLRPSAGPLDPPARLALWQRVFGRFFPWVWASIAVLLISGYTMLFVHFGGFAGAGAAHQCHAAHRHRHDAAVLASLFRAVATVFPRGRNRRVPGRSQTAQSDPPHRRHQSRARPADGGRRRQRPLLAVTPRARV